MAASSSSADAKVEAVWDGDKIVYHGGYVYLKVSHYFRELFGRVRLRSREYVQTKSWWWFALKRLWS